MQGYQSKAWRERTRNMWQTVGHERAINALRKGIQSGRLSHAYLLVGPASVGKMTLALDLARAVNCLGDDPPCGVCLQCRRVTRGLHADVHVLGLERQQTDESRTRVAIGIGQVRAIQREASLKPYEGKRRVLIFDGAERLSEEAANALLKTLEEPPDQVLLILLATDAETLPSTIVSRCALLKLRPLPRALLACQLQANHGADREKADDIARLSGGRLGWALEALGDPTLLKRRAERFQNVQDIVGGNLEERFSFAAGLASRFTRDRDVARQEIALWLEWWRDVMVVKEGAEDLVENLAVADSIQSVAQSLSSAQIAAAIGAINEASAHLESNVNARLALEGLMLALPRL